MTVSDTVIVSAFGTAFTVLGLVIKVLWSKLSSDFRYLLRKSEECENDREGLRTDIVQLYKQVGKTLTCPAQNCPNQEKKE
jgi:hypothetical protein